MRKISTICRFPGTIYPATIAGQILVFLLASTFALSGERLSAQILLPPPPAAAPPPALPPEKNPVIQKQHEREKKKVDEIKKIEQDAEDKKNRVAEERAKAEAKQKRPFYGLFELSLLKPTATVSKSRSNYRCDMTSHISSYVRILFDKDPGMVQGWVGLRIAPFGGYGTQKSFAGRFALTFIGPGIGVGRISETDDSSDDSPSRLMWLWSGGIAAINKIASEDARFKGAPSDFRSSGWAYESPGVWSELRWTRIIRGAIGYGAMAGLQTAAGKTFYYGGLTLSGFY